MKFASREWKFVEKTIIEYIVSLDQSNRDPKLDATQTAALRGKINGLEWVLNIPTREAVPDEVSPDIPEV